MSVCMYNLEFRRSIHKYEDTEIHIKKSLGPYFSSYKVYISHLAVEFIFLGWSLFAFLSNSHIMLIRPLIHRFYFEYSEGWQWRYLAQIKDPIMQILVFRYLKLSHIIKDCIFSPSHTQNRINDNLSGGKYVINVNI